MSPYLSYQRYEVRIVIEIPMYLICRLINLFLLTNALCSNISHAPDDYWLHSTPLYQAINVLSPSGSKQPRLYLQINALIKTAKVMISINSWHL